MSRSIHEICIRYFDVQIKNNIITVSTMSKQNVCDDDEMIILIKIIIVNIKTKSYSDGN